MQKPPKTVEVHSVEWSCVLCGEEVREKVQRHLRYLLRNRAQDEKRGNEGAFQQGGQTIDGGMQLTRQGSPTKLQAVRIASARRQDFFVAEDWTLGVTDKEEGPVTSIPGNEGRFDQAWVRARGGMLVFAVYFWHSEGWTSKMC